MGSVNNVALLGKAAQVSVKGWQFILETVGFAQELTAAEGIFADICNEIEKAEKFFPVPETAQAYLDATAAAAAGRGKCCQLMAL